MGKNPNWIHDQRKLVREIGSFDGMDRVMEIASLLSPYAVEANYPSSIRNDLCEEDAEDAYNMSMEMISMINSLMRQ